MTFQTTNDKIGTNELSLMFGRLMFKWKVFGAKKDLVTHSE